MITSERRGLVSEVAIGVMVCAAAWYFGVRPVERRADEARAQAEALVAQGVGSSAAGGLSLADLRAAAAVVAVKARAMSDVGRVAFNEARMLDELTNLARGHALRLEQLQPDAGPRVPKPTEGQTQHHDASIGYTLTVRGEFASIAAFLAQLPQTFPNSAVASVRLSAATDSAEPPVTAVISTHHWVFDATPAARLAEAALAAAPGDGR